MPASPTGWVPRYLDVCVTADQTGVKVVNTSPVVVLVRPTGSTRMSPAQFDLGDTLAEDAGRALAERLNRMYPQWRAVAPGQSTTAFSTTEPAFLEVSVDEAAAAAGYVLKTGVSYVESRLKTRPQRYADSVAACAQEAASTWAKAQASASADLDRLLVDASFGPVAACGSLFRQVASEAGDPPPKPVTLSGELEGLAKHTQANIYEDILKAVRRVAVQILG